MIYVGMDVHKKTTTFCALAEGGQVVKRGKVESDEENWSSIIRAWPATEVRVALETGNLSWWMPGNSS